MSEEEIGVNDPIGDNVKTQLKLKNQPIFWESGGKVINELRSKTKLFAIDGTQLLVNNGSIKIPEQGVFYYTDEKLSTGLTKLSTINNTNIDDIIKKNRVAAEQKRKLEEEYETAIHWEDHLPFDYNWFTIMGNRVAFATVFAFYDFIEGNWKFASQTIEYKA